MKQGKVFAHFVVRWNGPAFFDDHGVEGVLVGNADDGGKKRSFCFRERNFTNFAIIWAESQEASGSVLRDFLRQLRRAEKEVCWCCGRSGSIERVVTVVRRTACTTCGVRASHPHTKGLCLPCDDEADAAFEREERGDR